MVFGWFKHLMPRGLYGRAALILVLPVITIQLVVSVVFLQRHFERVTVQMTSSMMREIDYVTHLAEAAPDMEAAREAASAAAGPLGLEIVLPVEPETGVERSFLDLSGRVVVRSLMAEPEITAVELVGSRWVRVVIATARGPMEIGFDRNRVSASNPHQLLVLMVVTSLLMTIIAFLFLRNQLRPIARMAAAATAFGKGRIVPYRASGATEVRAAGAAFLDMRDRIERHIEQRTLMLSGISHDLRTPLTRMKLTLSMMPQDEDVTALMHDVDDLGRMANAFLDYARKGATESPAEGVDPRTFAAGIVEDARRAGHPVRLGQMTGTGVATFRPALLRRAVDNLIGNAAQHGSEVILSIDLGETQLRIVVEDDGPGIPPERREEALRPFARLDPARNQDLGQGVGLGLSIAADIAAAHGGRLHLGDSAALGGLKAELIIAR